MENIDIDWESLLNAYTNPSKQKKSKQKQWLKAKNLRPNQRICSNCRNVVSQPSYDPNEYTLYPYCPYCGKKKDGGESNETD